MKTAPRIFVLSICILSSCVVPLTQGGAHVIETKEQDVVQCDFIGLIDYHSPLGNIGEESSRNDFRSQAAALGATHVVYKTTPSGSIRGAGAYKCIEPIRPEVIYQGAPPQLPVYKKSPSGSSAPYNDGYRRY